MKDEFELKLKGIEEKITELKHEASRLEIRWLTDGLAGLEGYAWGLRDAISRSAALMPNKEIE